MSGWKMKRQSSQQTTQLFLTLFQSLSEHFQEGGKTVLFPSRGDWKGIEGVIPQLSVWKSTMVYSQNKTFQIVGDSRKHSVDWSNQKYGKITILSTLPFDWIKKYSFEIAFYLPGNTIWTLLILSWSYFG